MRITPPAHLLRARLWAGCTVMALLIASFLGANFVVHSSSSLTHHDLGLDFVAFYRAGVLIRTAHTADLYDLEKTRQFDRDLASREQLPLGDKFGPFLNPPFLAWIYHPLARLSYQTALLSWTLISLICFLAASCLLVRMIPSTDAKDWALIPALMAVSLPFLQTLGHAQNTCLSLLITAAVVTAWRSRRAFTAGLAAGLLFYKPQLAIVILIGLIITQGLPALAGFIASTAALLITNIITLPGSLTDYLRRIGPNVQYMLATHPYLWARHVTFRAFWQTLLNRSNPGSSSTFSIALAIACTTTLGLFLLTAIWRHRKTAAPDRIIAAVIATAPLLMPYYLDYDLLLLSVPAVLFAAETISRPSTAPRDRRLTRLWIAFYLLLLVNPALAQATQINFAVPLLTAIASISIARIRPDQTLLIPASHLDDEPEVLRVGSPWRALAS
jgi:hypothetical protein